MSISDRIRSRREELGMTQDDLAKRLGYKSRSSINKIELGKTDISQSKIEQFANALDTTPAALMGWDIKKETPDDKTAGQSMPMDISNDLLDIVKQIAALPDSKRQAIFQLIGLLLSEDSSNTGERG